MNLDSLPYKVFTKLKEKYPVVTVRLTDQDVSTPLLRTIYKTHREYVLNLFEKQGVDVYRFSHNYKSLTTKNPELGLVFLMGDSVVLPTYEIHALIGHNSRYKGAVNDN